MTYVEREFLALEVVSEFFYTVYHTEGFRFRRGIVTLRGGQLPAGVVHRHVLVGLGALHEHAPNHNVGCVHENVERSRPIQWLDH